MNDTEKIAYLSRKLDEAQGLIGQVSHLFMYQDDDDGDYGSGPMLCVECRAEWDSNDSDHAPDCPVMKILAFKDSISGRWRGSENVAESQVLAALDRHGDTEP